MLKKIILFGACCLLGSTFVSGQDRFRPTYLAILDSSKGRQLLNQCSRIVPANVKGFWQIMPQDRSLLERKFKRLLTKLSRQWGVGSNFTTFQGYCFQCVGVLVHRKRFIYISGFKMNPDDLKYDDYKKWESEPIVICDGGADVWGVLLNVRSKSFSQFEYNGEG